jgi:transcriptional regulator with XRE-family HTH domain
MTPIEFRDAQDKLRLSSRQIAELIHVSPRTISGWRSGRPPNGSAAVLVDLYISGYRPENWPKELRGHKRGRPLGSKKSPAG